MFDSNIGYCFGLRIQGENVCSYYNRYGICKYGPACKYDHPINHAYSPVLGDSMVNNQAMAAGIQILNLKQLLCTLLMECLAMDNDSGQKVFSGTLFANQGQVEAGDGFLIKVFRKGKAVNYVPDYNM